MRVRQGNNIINIHYNTWAILSRKTKCCRNHNRVSVSVQLKINAVYILLLYCHDAKRKV